jgi:uncharacterized Ntn-hydrolase superfamily protein
MTWSIVGRDEISGQLGVVVAGRCFAVGARVPFIAAKLGAIATQGLANPYHGIDALRLLRKGHTAAQVLEMLKSCDVDQMHRQLQVIDASGNVIVHTGERCLPWSSHAVGGGFSVAANMVAGKRVVNDTFEAYIENSALPFARRLIAAMEAGEAAGGDSCGTRSAALTIVGDDEWSALDLRVDDHHNSINELSRLEEVSKEWVRYRPFVPTRANPAGITDLAVIDAALGSLPEV